MGTDYTILAPSRRGTVTRLICGTAFALGCSYSSEPYRQAEKVGVHGVTVTPQAIEFFAIGETKSLTAKISPSDATDQTISWESTDSTVASVDSVGRVTARSAGFGVFITVTTHDGRHEASANVSVNP